MMKIIQVSEYSIDVIFPLYDRFHTKEKERLKDINT